jgi:hypothetical protein
MNSQEFQNKELKTAVLFLVFNRPDVTSQVFKAIRRAKPPRLYVAADGPREGKLDEAERVEEVRIIATEVDWPCEVKTLFRDKNLGCKKGVSSAITWFFEQEEQGIILEDDCLPHLDFFSFCENLLDFYSKDHRLLAITGNNFQNNKWRGEASYYFSKYFHCWGWATWKRSWKNYDGGIKFWPEWSNSEAWSDYIPDKVERRYWKKIFDLVHAGKIDSWAYPMLASIWYKNGLVVTPNVNLVGNIGFGEDATHTIIKNSQESNIPTQSLGNIIHPKIIEINYDADKYDFEYTFNGRNLRFPKSWIVMPKRILYFVLRKIHQLIKLIF